jgi:hypothetical protein
MSLKEIIDISKQFTGAQWAAVISIIGAGIYGYNWVEDRYAHKDSVELVLENIIRVDSKISALITTQYTPEQIDKINQNAKLYEDQMRRYLDTKK